MQIKKQIRLKNKLLMKLIHRDSFFEGTLAVTERMCGSKVCPCKRGKKHKAMYLTWKEERKTKSMYVPVKKQTEALVLSENYKKLKKIIRELSELHKTALVQKEKT